MSEWLERAERLEAAKEYLEKEVHRAHLMHDRDKLADLGHFHEAIQQVEQLESENKRLREQLEEIHTYCIEAGITSKEMLQMSEEISEIVEQALKEESE